MSRQLRGWLLFDVTLTIAGVPSPPRVIGAASLEDATLFASLLQDSADVQRVELWQRRSGSMDQCLGVWPIPPEHRRRKK